MRVAVIGAGPAGMAAAIALRERGVEVVVLEREAVIGGKCHSLAHGRHAYDLGANLTTARYHLIRGWADTLGMTQRRMSPRRLVHVDDPHTALAAPLADADALARLLVRGGAELYLGFRELAGMDRQGYAGLPEGVRRPFKEWLGAHGLEKFREVFANLFVAYGYGVMDELPAAYALKFFDRVHLMAAVDVILGNPVEDTHDFAEGFQALWERAAAHWGLDVVTGANVVRVRRQPDGVRVRCVKDGQPHDVAADQLVVACPLDVALGFLDASTEERRLFSRIQYYEYFVTAARTAGLPPVSTYVQPYCVSVHPGSPTVFYRPSADDPADDVFLFYAYGGDGVTVESVRGEISRVVDVFGGRVTEWLHTQTWRYFPHVSAPDMIAGFYEDVDAIQGWWHTWYVGEALSFTLVELAAEFSVAMMDRAFPS